MKDENKLVITIGRQFGSGGCEVGTKLAQELGLDFYDKNILRMNSDESGIEESFYYLADGKAGNKLLYKIIKSLTPEKGAPSFGSDLISADNLFRFQSEVIRKLAAEENCIIMGRCAYLSMQTWISGKNVPLKKNIMLQKMLKKYQEDRQRKTGLFPLLYWKRMGIP